MSQTVNKVLRYKLLTNETFYAMLVSETINRVMRYMKGEVP